MKRLISQVLGSAALFSLLTFSVTTNAADSRGAWSVAAQMPTARTEIVADACVGAARRIMTELLALRAGVPQGRA